MPQTQGSGIQPCIPTVIVFVELAKSQRQRVKNSVAGAVLSRGGIFSLVSSGLGPETSHMPGSPHIGNSRDAAAPLGQIYIVEIPIVRPVYPCTVKALGNISIVPYLRDIGGIVSAAHLPLELYSGFTPFVLNLKYALGGVFLAPTGVIKRITRLVEIPVDAFQLRESPFGIFPVFVPHSELAHQHQSKRISCSVALSLTRAHF